MVSALVTSWKDKKREIKIVSQIQRIANNLNAYKNNVATDETQSLCIEALADWVASNDNYLASFLLDENGKVIACHDGDHIGYDFSDHSVFLNSKNSDEVKVGTIEKSFLTKDKDVIYLSCPVYTDNYRGILGLETTLDFYNSLVKGIYLGETGSSLIVDETGRIICHTQEGFIESEFKIDIRLDSILTDYKSGLVNKQGTKNYSLNNEKKILGYYVIDEMNWVFISTQKYSEINQPIKTLENTMIYIGSVTLFFTIIICFFFIKLFMKPINTLEDVFTKASIEGKYIKCEIKGKSEFAHLSTGYNKMMDTLKSKDSELLQNYQLLETEQQKTKFLAYHDSVTNLLNRRGFEQKMMEILNNNLSGAVLHVTLGAISNLDGLLGFQVSDSLFKNVSNRLQKTIDKDDVIARGNGTGFYIVRISPNEKIEQFLNELQKLFDEPIVVDGIIFNVKLFIGISLFNEKDNKFEDIMRSASIAMYEARETNQTSFRYYNESMQHRIKSNYDLLNVLDEVIMNNELSLVYQPEVNNDNEEVIAFEALMRLKSKKLGFISPAVFIPMAEETGKIIEIGKWAMKNILKFAKDNFVNNENFQYVAINISTVQLAQTDFVDTVLEIINDVKIDYEFVLLEITESMLMSESKANIEKLVYLRSLGIKVALDDFGTGYSSMQYLTELPLDILKIDKYFIDEIDINEKKQGVVETIIKMAHHLNLKVVAEGVETKQQREILKKMNCDIIQGYYYYKPLSEKELDEKKLL